MSADRLRRDARILLSALPIWAVLLFLGTIDHQPPPQSDFPEYAQFTTTTRFLVSHIVASIVGAGVGNVAFAALFVLLALRGSGRLALWAMPTAVIGNTVITAVFGSAAFAQPAIGRMYQAGQTGPAVAFQNEVYGVPLAATAFGGVLLLCIGLVLFGVAVARSGWLPRWAGIGLVVSAPLFAIIGVILADIVQSIGAAGLIASSVWITWRTWRTP